MPSAASWALAGAGAGCRQVPHTFSAGPQQGWARCPLAGLAHQPAVSGLASLPVPFPQALCASWGHRSVPWWPPNPVSSLPLRHFCGHPFLYQLPRNPPRVIDGRMATRRGSGLNRLVKSGMPLGGVTECPSSGRASPASSGSDLPRTGQAQHGSVPSAWHRPIWRGPP